MPLPKLKSVEQKEGEGEPTKPGPESRADARTAGTVGDIMPAEMDAAALEALRECLKATRRFWDRDSKSWICEPDHAARKAAAELILAYSRGRPVERRFELRGTVETFEDRKQVLMKSPEGVRFLLAAGAIGQQEAAEALVQLVPESE